MTTESTPRPRDPGARVLGGATLVSLAVAVVTSAVGYLVGGSSAFAGALSGGVVLALVMAFGTYVVHVVAHAVPALSLLMALMTYALQLVLVTAFCLVLVRSGDLGDAVDGTWLIVGLVASSITWSAVQIWLSSRARIPMYDLARAESSHGREPGA